eukprot:scaffold59015_cov31-Tisochrysis_lutea.AAC.2
MVRQSSSRGQHRRHLGRNVRLPKLVAVTDESHNFGNCGSALQLHGGIALHACRCYCLVGLRGWTVGGGLSSASPRHLEWFGRHPGRKRVTTPTFGIFGRRGNSVRRSIAEPVFPGHRRARFEPPATVAIHGPLLPVVRPTCHAPVIRGRRDALASRLVVGLATPVVVAACLATALCPLTRLATHILSDLCSLHQRSHPVLCGPLRKRRAGRVARSHPLCLWGHFRPLLSLSLLSLSLFCLAPISLSLFSRSLFSLSLFSLLLFSLSLFSLSLFSLSLFFRSLFFRPLFSRSLLSLSLFSLSMRPHHSLPLPLLAPAPARPAVMQPVVRNGYWHIRLPPRVRFSRPVEAVEEEGGLVTLPCRGRERVDSALPREQRAVAVGDE